MAANTSQTNSERLRMRGGMSIHFSCMVIALACSTPCLLAQHPHGNLPASQLYPAFVSHAAGRRTLSELHGFCSSCDSRDKSNVPPCECYAYCCARGYSYKEPSSICEEVLGADGESNCADPCIFCSTVNNPSTQEACFQGCCMYDFFADSCRAWRLSSMDIFVSGTKVIKDSAGERFQGKRGHREQEKTDPIDLLDDVPCAATVDCAEYCYDMGSGVEQLDLYSVCPADQSHTGVCGGLACEKQSSNPAPDGCFCCCSKSSKGRRSVEDESNTVFEELSGTALGNNINHTESPHQCDLRHQEHRCSEFCARRNPGSTALACERTGLGEHTCGGHTCEAKSHVFAPDGCFCCCTDEANAVEAAARNPRTAERRATVTAAKEDRNPLAVSCPITGNCHSYCKSQSGPATFVHSSCPALPSAQMGTPQAQATCGGWGCSHTSGEAAEEGCTCCCSSHSDIANQDECNVAANHGTCLAFCARFEHGLQPLSCALEEATGGASVPSTGCGGHKCAQWSQDIMPDGCYCCCAES